MGTLNGLFGVICGFDETSLLTSKGGFGLLKCFIWSYQCETWFWHFQTFVKK